MKVKELLNAKKKPVTIKQNRTVEDGMKILIENKIGSLIIVDKIGYPVGIVTERDIFHLAFRYRGDMMDMIIGDNMTSNLIMANSEDDVDKIAELISKNKIRHVPIMENNSLIGVISIRDIVMARAENLISE